MDTPVPANQQGIRYTSSVQTLYVIWRTYLEGWTIETDGKKEGICAVSVLYIIIIKSCFQQGFP